jgi:hypothetical protein
MLRGHGAVAISYIDDVRGLWLVAAVLTW